MERAGRKKHKKSETGIALLFLFPSLTGVSIFVLVPFLDVIRRSFYNTMGTEFKGLENYKQVINNTAFQQAVMNTSRFLLICIPLLLFLSLIISLMLTNQKKYADFFKTSYLIPMAIPVASVVLLWKLFFHSNGLINVMLLKFGMESIDFMNTDKAFYILVFSYLWKNTGYDMVLWLTGLSGISTSLYEAADVDGAGKWGKFRYITLPGLKPTIYIIIILAFVNSFKVFREAYLISGDYPHESIYMLQHIFSNWFMALDIQKLCAAAVLSAVVFLIIILLLNRLNRGEE